LNFRLLINFINKLTSQYNFSTPAFAAKAYLVLALPIAIIISVLYAPLQAPDEASHLMRAYIISNGQLGVDSHDGSSGGMVDINLKKYIATFGGLPFHYETKVTSQMIADAALLKWSGRKEFTKIHGAMLYPPIIYAPQAMTLKFGQSVGLSISQSYSLVRLINLLMVILLYALLIYLLPLGREFAVVIGLLPMVLSQLSTSVIEGEILVLMLFTLVCFCRGVDLNKSWGGAVSLGSMVGACSTYRGSPCFFPAGYPSYICSYN